MKIFFVKAIILLSLFLSSVCTFAQVQIDSVIVTPETCSGNCDGMLTIYTLGGTGTELFDIGGAPQTSNVFIGLCATSYTVTVNDALPSSDATTATILSPSPLTFTISTVDASYGMCDGFANVIINGGTPPYIITYYADSGITVIQSDTLTSLMNLCPSTYYVGVSDANSCPSNGPGGSGLSSFSIAESSPPPLVVTQSYFFEGCLCPGGSNSSTLHASGGVPPYTYSWGSPSITGICVTDFIPAWTVTDDIGQQQSGGGSQLPYQQPYVSATINNQETCAGACDGKITVTIITPGNGFPPYEYSIDGGFNWQPSPIFSGLCPATYQFYTRDTHFCLSSTYSTSSGYTIQPKTDLTYTLSTTNCSANGVCDGLANVTINGGTSPYVITYYASDGTTILQTGSSTSKIGLCAGTYYVKVTDANNCSSTGPSGTDLNMFSVSQPPPTLIVNQVFQMPHCYPNCDGNTQLIASGGVPPYTYSWGSWDLGGFCDGDNAPAWTVTDSIGQQVSGASLYMIANQPQINTIINSHETCLNACDGEMEITITGGEPPYTFSIDSGVTSQSNLIFNNLCPNTYTLYYSDSYGCGGNQPFTINTATPIVVTTDTIIDVTCIGGCNGGATIDVVGGTPPYSYLWNDSLAQTTATVSGLCTGTYTCIVIDSNGCDTTINLVINEPLGDTLTATWHTLPESCYGICDGSAMVTVNGGVPPYVFQWDDPCLTTTDSSVCAGCQGTYNCIITDSNGCSITVSGITVSGPDSLIATAVFVSNPTSIGACDGVANGTVLGGTAPYAYLWNGCFPTTLSSTIIAPDINILCDGEYQLIVEDANGCIDSSECVTIVDSPTNINQNSSDDIKNIYPNPTKGLINIEFSEKISLPITIELIDTKGRIVKSYSINSKNSVIDLTSFQKGIYVLNNTKLSINKTIILE